MFSQKRNHEWGKKAFPTRHWDPIWAWISKSSHYDVLPDEPWRGHLQRGKIQPAALQEAIRMYANVIMWITIVMRAVKAGA